MMCVVAVVFVAGMQWTCPRGLGSNAWRARLRRRRGQRLAQREAEMSGRGWRLAAGGVYMRGRPRSEGVNVARLYALAAAGGGRRGQSASEAAAWVDVRRLYGMGKWYDNNEQSSAL
jgi:hypothetical protein